MNLAVRGKAGCLLKTLSAVCQPPLVWYDKKYQTTISPHRYVRVRDIYREDPKIHFVINEQLTDERRVFRGMFKFVQGIVGNNFKGRALTSALSQWRLSSESWLWTSDNYDIFDGGEGKVECSQKEPLTLN